MSGPHGRAATWSVYVVGRQRERFTWKGGSMEERGEGGSMDGGERAQRALERGAERALC